MIYMEPSSMGWRPIFLSWVNMLPQTLTDLHKDLIKELFNRFVDACIRTVRKAIEVRVSIHLLSNEFKLSNANNLLHF